MTKMKTPKVSKFILFSRCNLIPTLTPCYLAFLDLLYYRSHLVKQGGAFKCAVITLFSSTSDGVQFVTCSMSAQFHFEQ